MGNRLPVGGRTPWLRLRVPYDIAEVQVISFMLVEGDVARDAVLLIANLTWLDDPPATATIEALPEL